MESFGRYQLLRRIGSGGMAEIYLARSMSLDGFAKELVVKRVRRELSSNQRFSSMFIEEGRLSITLSHPNIVQVFDFGEQQGVYYLAMEYVEGCNLKELLELPGISGVGLATPLALLVVGEVLQALDYAHNKRDRRGESLHIVHCDVSPQNVFLSLAGAVKLGDFGIAKARGSPARSESGTVLGKLAYMAPEYLRGEKSDPRMDIYSVGVVLWELLVGRPLFAGAARERAFDELLAAAVEPPSRCNANVSAAADPLVLRALARDPALRYGSARELGEQIHAYLVTHHPEANLYALTSFIAAHSEDIAGRREAIFGAPMPSPARIVAQACEPVPAALRAFSEPVRALVEDFRRKPSLWCLLDLAALSREEGDIASAQVCYRVAAAEFARRGLLVQALLCSRRLLELTSASGLASPYELLAAIPGLVDARDDELCASLLAGDDKMSELLRELLSEVASRDPGFGQATPILARLDGASFAELAMMAPLQSFGEGENIVEQGDGGRAMYLVARGRVLIYAVTPASERVYLSSLTAGDFFGENAFFTGALRNATVEAAEPTDVFLLDRPLYNRVTAAHPEASGILLQFYKERIVDTVLAKSPVFGVLDKKTRREVIELFTPRVFRDGELFIREGARSDQIYLIKEGEAEVFTEVGGRRTVLSAVGAGTIVGEVAALRGIPRTASVQARGKLEVLELGRLGFDALLDAEPELKQRVLEVVRQRARDNLDRLLEQRA